MNQVGRGRASVAVLQPVDAPTPGERSSWSKAAMSI
jgi:hypothetical protein